MASIKAYSLKAWVRDAKRGEVIMYHRGSLMKDRQVGKNANMVNDIARTMWQCYLDGLVHLVQNKYSENIYEYLAIKR